MAALSGGLRLLNAAEVPFDRCVLYIIYTSMRLSDVAADELFCNSSHFWWRIAMLKTIPTCTVALTSCLHR